MVVNVWWANVLPTCSRHGMLLVSADCKSAALCFARRATIDRYDGI